MGMAEKYVGIRQAEAVGDGTKVISFPVVGKPYGFLVSCDNDDIDSSVKRASGLWTEYNGGQYVGGRYTISTSSGYDHYNLANAYINYDDEQKTLTLNTTAATPFKNGVTYYLWYFTIPF